MRFAAVSLFLLALTACSQAVAPQTPTGEYTALSGDYKASSNTARAITGAMIIQRGGVTFNNGVILYTVFPRRRPSCENGARASRLVV